MSIKSKVLAAAATVAFAGGLCLSAGTSTTWAATPSCGGFPCVNVFSHEFGDYANPNYVLDVLRQGAKVGQPIILYKGSNADPAEDFTLSFQGTVSDFYAAGLVSSAVELHYGCNRNQNTGICSPTAGPDEAAFELEYAPFGVDSGLCVGVARTAAANEGVTLQPCGVSAKTVWIWDTYDQCDPWLTICKNYNGWTFPAINGSDTNFSHPYVLTYPSNGYPTDSPRPQLLVDRLTGFSGGFGPGPGTVNDFQEWGADFGVLR